MFTNVLIAEDHQSLKDSVEQTLRKLGVADPQYAYYCDDALQRLKRAQSEREPFELLITDLSFRDDGRRQEIRDGIGLIQAAKGLQPDLKVLVFSIESNPDVVRDLFQQTGIDGYVEKGRDDVYQLQEAVLQLAAHKKYIPLNFRQTVRTKNAYDFTDTDVMILSQLVQGTLQKNIPAFLEKQGLKASSLRSVEKSLQVMKEALQCTTNEQLIAYCKDRRII